MKRIVLTVLTITLVTAAAAQPKERPKMTSAKGTFEVKIMPDPAGAEYGRMSIDKKFIGDLDATGNGEMLSASRSDKGSAAYVAIERVTGTLHGARVGDKRRW